MSIESGIIILDKPKGITSNDAVQKVKKILGISRAGNSGTLDPNATGVLVICLGNTTKIMPALQGLDKEYLATIHFHQGISKQGLSELANKFTGKINQTPPVKSAVARKLRQREVYSIDILNQDGKDFVLNIQCQAGTYIRKIASDMGCEVGGAHLKELRRTAVGNFKINDAVEMEELKRLANEGKLEKAVLPEERGVEHINHLNLKESSLKKAVLGKTLSSVDFLGSGKQIKNGELIALMLNEELIALACYGEKIYIERVIKSKK
jgi:H/ACA ribonucleoprotein complex subunit 4